MTDITVIKIQPLTHTGNLRAFADVKIGPVEIKGFRVIQQPGQKAWVSVPQQQSREGRYFNMVDFDDMALLDRVRATVLSAWEAAHTATAPSPLHDDLDDLLGRAP